MEHKLQKLQPLKDITLTDAERGLIRAHATYLIANTPQSPQRIYSLFQSGVQHGLRIALSSFLFFIFVGGAVTAVANQALPGDSLYGVKTEFNEEVVAFFHKSPEEKVAYNTKRVETRVQEIKTLAASKTLTKAKQATVQKALDSHVKELTDDLNTLSTTAPTAALSATTTLEESLKASKVVIENAISEDGKGKEEAIKTVDDAITSVSNQEVKIISKEIDSIAASITTTPTPVSDSLDTPPASTPVEP